MFSARAKGKTTPGVRTRAESYEKTRYLSISGDDSDGESMTQLPSPQALIVHILLLCYTCSIDAISTQEEDR